MHVHVGWNTPGYLPEAEPLCFDDVHAGVEAFRHELRDCQAELWERCEAARQGGGCECAWCDAAADVEAALGAIADGDVVYVLASGPTRTAERTWSTVVRPPEGAGTCFWISVLTTPVDECALTEASVR